MTEFDPAGLKGPDPTQWDDREFEGPVPAGRYVFKAPDEFIAELWTYAEEVPTSSTPGSMVWIRLHQIGIHVCSQS